MLDFYRTFATIVGASARVPTDRPIDSIDQTDFVLGKQDKSNRDYAIFFHGDDLLAVKWRNFKVHLTVRVPAEGAVKQAGQGVTTAYSLKVNYPWVFNVEDDPKELWNINMSSGWIAVKAAEPLLEYKASLKITRHHARRGRSRSARHHAGHHAGHDPFTARRLKLNCTACSTCAAIICVPQITAA